MTPVCRDMSLQTATSVTDLQIGRNWLRQGISTPVFRAAIVFPSPSRTTLALIQELEVFLFEVSDRPAFGVADHYQPRHKIHLAAEMAGSLHRVTVR